MTQLKLKGERDQEKAETALVREKKNYNPKPSSSFSLSDEVGCHPPCDGFTPPPPAPLPCAPNLHPSSTFPANMETFHCSASSCAEAIKEVPRPLVKEPFPFKP